jgi:glycosyltransferase involved in cell wall biosynthesis
MNSTKTALIWNAHWNALGGGEKYALELGNMLAERGYKVFFAGTCQFPGEKISEIFDLEILASQYLMVSFEEEVYSLASGSDLFINASFGSRMRSPHFRSIYICHFPFVNKFERLFSRYFYNNSTFRSGFSQMYSDFQGKIITQQESTFRLSKERDVKFISATNAWSISREGDNMEVRELGGNTSLSPGLYFIENDSTESSTLQVKGFEQPNLRSFLVAYLNQRMNFKDTYKQVWVHSEYVSSWTKKLWFRDPVVVYPPVTTNRRSSKIRNPYKIVSVGRFMSKKAGHSKNQLEMVEAFSILTRKSKLPWELHLVGGVSGPQLKYFEKVQRSIKGLNVVLHPDAPIEELDELYATSTYYWHASGMNQPKSQPGRFEHFGITVVEAMSSGLIPLAFNVGGPAEILGNFEELLFSSKSDLVNKMLGISEENILNLRGKLIDRASEFDTQRFQLSAIKNIESLKYL